MSGPCPRCGTEDPDGRLGSCPRCLLEGDAEPVILGGTLELLEEIGRGGMGTVYKARHLRLGRLVAVKFLPLELASNPEFQKRFEREARALALLNHPNIVAIHDFGHSEGESYIVMEYVEGGPLTPKLPLPPDRARTVLLQVCDAVAQAHRQGVIHRDLKPENILMDAGGNAKVTDFGIARIVRPGGPLWTVTTRDLALGTPQYMAPEVLDGAPPDPRMDVYSLGVLLYQALTGRVPAGVFEPAPAPFDAIVRRALASDPAQRFADAGEMGDAIAGRSSAPREPALPPEERSFVRGVAILQSISTAMALWAFLHCVKPKVLESAEMLPLVSIGNEKLPDGRILSRARFETGWVLAACGTFAVAIVAYGFLRRHWRRSGFEVVAPDLPVRAASGVFWAGAAALGVYGIRRLLDAGGHVWAALYMPVLGGFIEVVMLYLFWCTVLEGWRTARPLRREPLLWLGCLLALIPPVHELVKALGAGPG